MHYRHKNLRTPLYGNKEMLSETVEEAPNFTHGRFSYAMCLWQVKTRRRTYTRVCRSVIGCPLRASCEAVRTFRCDTLLLETSTILCQRLAICM